MHVPSGAGSTFERRPPGNLTGNPSPPVIILQVTLEFVWFFLLGLGNLLFLCQH
jgi:hypothetical protein